MRLRSSHSPATGIPNEPLRARKPIGEMLNIAPNAAEAVAQRQRETGGLFGETAVEMGVASTDQVRRAIEAQQGFAVLETGDDRIDPMVIAAFDPDDPVARAARDLRSRVTSTRMENGEPVRSVALVGIGAADETALLSSNLAVACAQAGHATLLIDANLEMPHQHNLFRQPNRFGLSTLLSGANDAGGVSQQTAILPLSLITAGPIVPNAFELLDRQRLARTLLTLDDRFELIVIDGARATDHALAACEGVDAAILIARRDVSGARDIQDAAAHIRRSGTQIIGTVISS